MDQQTELKLVIDRLRHYSRGAETLIETLERLLKDRELGIYDLSRVNNATEESRGLRILFAAAILSSPEKMLRVTAIAQHALAGPDS